MKTGEAAFNSDDILMNSIRQDDAGAFKTEDLTKQGMRRRIHNERKIELSMEGHRFFDTRRWLIAHTPECT